MFYIWVEKAKSWTFSSESVPVPLLKIIANILLQ